MKILAAPLADAPSLGSDFHHLDVARVGTEWHSELGTGQSTRRGCVLTQLGSATQHQGELDPGFIFPAGVGSALGMFRRRLTCFALTCSVTAVAAR